MSTYLVAFIVGELESTEPVSRRRPLRVCASRASATWRPSPGRGLQPRFFERYYGSRTPATRSTSWRFPTSRRGPWRTWGPSRSARPPSWSTRQPRRTGARAGGQRRRPRGRPHVVWRPRDDGVVERHLAERGVRHLHGAARGRRLEARVEALGKFRRSRAAAMGVDGLRQPAHRVRRPRAARCEAMFDLLTYKKGASVLRMLEQHIGPDTFREGVRLPGGTSTRTRRRPTSGRRSGRRPGSRSRIMDAWVFHPGYPLVSARLRNGKIELGQRRYLISGEEEDDAVWDVPLLVRDVRRGRTRADRAGRRVDRDPR